MSIVSKSTILKFPCADGVVVAMSRKDFLKLAGDQESKILLGLATNSFPTNGLLEYDEHAAIDQDIFMKYGVPASVLTVISYCVRVSASTTGEKWSLSSDMEVQEVVSGRLRHFSTVLGGFPSVDAAIRSYDDTNKAAAAAIQYRSATKPADDTIGMFDWKCVGPVASIYPHNKETNGSIHVREFVEQGYELGQIEEFWQQKEANGSIGGSAFYHMRRMRDKPVIDGIVSEAAKKRKRPEDNEDNI